MTQITVGIVDYGVGNYASLKYALKKIGYRCRISADSHVLQLCDIIFLPGVGTFPIAMKSLRQNELDIFLLEYAHKRKPIIGICLGMQLLTDASYEQLYTSGLGLIHGEIIPLEKPKYHVGWNTLESIREDEIFNKMVKEDTFYFNHSYIYHGPEEHQVCVTRADTLITSVIRSGLIIGVQFHPEKSQLAGRLLLKYLIDELCCA